MQIDYVSIIKSRVSIMDILRHYNIDTKRGGFVSCPFHGADKNPSMKVYERQNRAKCFSCGVMADVIHFVELMQVVDFKGAISYLDNAFSLGLNQPLTDEQKKEWAKQLREKQKQAKRASNLAEFERKIFDRLITEIGTNKALIANTAPQNLKELEVYALTDNCNKHIEAQWRQKWLDWLFSILMEDSNGFLHDSLIYFTEIYGYDKKNILRMIYKKEIEL